MEGLIYMVTFIVSISIIGNFILIYKSYKKYKRFSATPYFNEALVGLYVKFMGKVVSSNRFKRPRTQKEAAFYQFHVLGYRKIKRKKPESGYHEVPTNLYSESSGEFILQDEKSKQKVSVALDIPKLEKASMIDIKEEKLESKTLLDGYEYENGKLSKNYIRFEYTSNYLKQYNSVTVYGRVIKKNDRYIITNSYNKDMPLRIELGDQLSKKALFYDQIRGKVIYTTLAFIALGWMHI
jgi:hypothetical protein